MGQTWAAGDDGKLQLSIHQVSQEVVHYYKITLQAGAIRYLNLFLSARQDFNTNTQMSMTWNLELIQSPGLAPNLDLAPESRLRGAMRPYGDLLLL